MQPRLAPRASRKKTTQFLPPIPPTYQSQPRSRKARDRDNNINGHNRNEETVGMELLSAVASRRNNLLSSSSPRSQGSLPAGSTTSAAWSPPRSSLRKGHSNANALVIATNEGCTTPTENSQLFFHSLYHHPSTSGGRIDDASLALTPPASVPAPLLVSAKRLGTEVRRRHSKRRRASWRSYMSNSGTSGSKERGSQDDADQLNPPRVHVRRGRSRGCHRWSDNNKEGDEDDTGNTCMLSPSWDSSSDDDDDDDGESLLLPTLLQNMSTHEQTRHYWQWCYGSDPSSIAPTPPNVAVGTSGPPISWSASRAPPTRSCLSSTQKVSLIGKPTGKPTQDQGDCWTPKASPDETSPATKTTRSNTHKTKSVQFGSPKAAEYDVDAPSVSMTPLPSEVARARFPVHIPEDNPTDPSEQEHELEMIKETKLNTQVLQAWEVSFEDFVDEDSYDDDDGEEGEDDNKENHDDPGGPISSQCVLPAMDIDDGGTIFDFRAREKRRSSGFFSQSDVSAALLSSSDSDDEENDEEDDGRFVADEEMDESITCHIATLSVTTAMSSSPVVDQASNNSVIIPQETPSSNSDNSMMKATPSSNSDNSVMEATPSTTDKIVLGMTPPSDVSFSSVQSSGAALSKSAMSPNSQRRRSRSYVADETTDIVGKLRNHPNANLHDWDTSALFRTMARHKIPTISRSLFSSRIAEGGDGITPTLASVALNSCCDDFVRCGFDDFVASLDCYWNSEMVGMTQATTCSKQHESKPSRVTTSSDYNWMRLEVGFLERVEAGLQDASTEIAALRGTVPCSKASEIEFYQANLRRRSLWRQRKQLENSILRVQDAVSRQRRSRELIKAKMDRIQTRYELERAIPFSVLTFQVTSALVSFQMVGCTDGIAQWRMDHVVDGVESEVTWNMETGELSGCLVSNNRASFSQFGKIPKQHVASQLHQILAVKCMEECQQFLYHGGEEDFSPSKDAIKEVVPNCLARLAMVLGRIDFVARSLWSVAEEPYHQVSLMSSFSECSIHPTHVMINIGIDVSQERAVRISFDSSALPMPSKVEWAMVQSELSDCSLWEWSALDYPHSSQPWALTTLFQDICMAAGSLS